MHCSFCFPLCPQCLDLSYFILTEAGLGGLILHRCQPLQGQWLDPCSLFIVSLLRTPHLTRGIQSLRFPSFPDRGKAAAFCCSLSVWETQSPNASFLHPTHLGVIHTHSLQNGPIPVASVLSQ